MVDRETDDRGDEVVVTEVKYQVCERCGSRRTLGENKEVRSKPDEDDDVTEPAEVAYEEPEETEDAVFVDGSDGSGGDEAMAAAPGRQSGSTEMEEPEDADYRCPDCGHSSGDSSLREGDVCPECGSGYLESL